MAYTALALLRQLACSTIRALPARARSRRTHMGPFVFVPKDFIYNEPDPSMLPLEFDETTGWTQQSRRVGVLARKVGMTTEFNEWMDLLPITVLHVPKCEVTQVKDEATHGFTAIQVGSGDRKAKNISKAVLKHLEKAGVGPKAKITEFRVTPDAIIPVGTCISVRHFLPGQLLDIQGTSKGKGFQGGMKRWGFRGLSATHGVSVSHRSIGSTGQNQTPGKVWKGKKMPGRMGGETVTQKNLYLWKIDVEHELLYIKGAVPGPAGGWLRVMDAKNKLFVEPPPFPTFVAPADEIEAPKVLFAKMQRNQAKIGAFSEEEKELIRSSPNYPYMAPLRDETEKEKAFKGYRPAEFVEGE